MHFIRSAPLGYIGAERSSDDPSSAGGLSSTGAVGSKVALGNIDCFCGAAATAKSGGAAEKREFVSATKVADCVYRLEPGLELHRQLNASMLIRKHLANLVARVIVKPSECGLHVGHHFNLALRNSKRF